MLRFKFFRERCRFNVEQITLIIADCITVVSLVYDFRNISHYRKHIKLLSAGEKCKFLKESATKKISTCTHPNHKRIFANGMCLNDCSKRLGENVEISTFEYLEKHNPFFIFKFILEIISGLFFLFATIYTSRI